MAETPHPRLWMTNATEKKVRAKIDSDPLAAKLHDLAILQANEILYERTTQYDIPDGRRLLHESRVALKNIIHTAWAWRLTGEEKYRARAIKELDAASSLKDWNPSHFLDTAEMALAVAIGYDWLHGSLTSEQLEKYEQAIIQKALIPAKIRFDRDEWWTGASNNWAQVCGSGIGIAAAVIADKDQKLSEEIFTQCVALVEKCKHFYEPDGMYPEGPGYWHYGTNYHVMLLAACEEFKHPMEQPASLARSGNAMMHLTSPTQLPFNFSDGKAKIGNPTPAQSWIASHYNKNAQSNNVRSRLTTAASSEKPGVYMTPLTILWLPEPPDQNTNLPTHAYFNGEQSVAVFRTNWENDAAWLAIKGGTPEGGHGHMDVGSFCYDAHGIRWVHDLGADDYNMPGYFRDQRFTYYRLQNRAHNTLEIDGKLQDESSEPCPITSTKSQDGVASATFDLSNAYQNAAHKVTRSAEFNAATGSARIKDVISKPAGEIIWRAFTKAKCSIKNDTVTLTQEGDSITIKRHSPLGAWSIESPTPPLEIENPNEGFKVITLTIPKGNRIPIDIEIRP